MGNCAEVVVNVELYTREVIFRACYKFTDRSYLFLRPGENATIVIEVQPKTEEDNPDRVIGDLKNELIDQRVRADLARETQSIRELIVAQAFADAPLR